MKDGLGLSIDEMTLIVCNLNNIDNKYSGIRNRPPAFKDEKSWSTVWKKLVDNFEF